MLGSAGFAMRSLCSLLIVPRVACPSLCGFCSATCFAPQGVDTASTFPGTYSLEAKRLGLRCRRNL